MGNTQDNSDGMKYVKSLRGADKRGFAMKYLTWIRGGKLGPMPGRGRLSPVLAKAVCTNLEDRS